jgi:DNA polymerase-3 subunit alpha
MSLQILKDKCVEKLNKLALNDGRYLERLDREFKIFNDQNPDYVNDLFDYFKKCLEYVKSNGKVKNTPHLLVLFILGITDDDPIVLEMELIKTKSQEFPDIDMDFEDTKRELVKEYLVSKYGHQNVANIIAFGTIKAKSAMKDISRIANIPLEDVEEATKSMELDESLEKAYNGNPTVRNFFDKYSSHNLYDMCAKIEGNVRQVTKHPAGIVIAPFNLHEVVGLQEAKENRNGDKEVVTCWEEGESRELSKIGLIKFDVLGVNTLTIIHDTLKLIKKLHNVDIDINNISLKDKSVIQGFHEARTIGVFQFEREWIRKLLEKIKINKFEDISAVNALNRPGPLDAGMETKFWKVKNGFEKPNYLHPKLIPILNETYSIILYQEQIIRIANELAGWAPDEADAFRSIVSKGKNDLSKGINLFAKYEKLFIDSCMRNGVTGRINVIRTISDNSEIPSTATEVKTLEEKVESGVLSKKIACNVEISDEIFYQIKAFARYGFNKAHSTAYGFMAFQSMYLKTHYPKEFMSMLMSNTPNTENPKTGENKFIDYLFEARRLGIKILPPDINKSDIYFSIEGDSIRCGFSFIKGLGEKALPDILTKRPFTSFTQFLNIADSSSVNKTAMLALIYSGCFDEFLRDKTDITGRFDLANELFKRRRSKDIAAGDLERVVKNETDVCGGEIFHSEFSSIDLEAINSTLKIDDKIMQFDKLEIINIGTTIRVIAKVEKLFIKRGQKNIGFLHTKNGRLKKSFMMWNESVAKLEKDEALSECVKDGSIISFRVQRQKDYNDRKSFIVDVESIMKVEKPVASIC